MPDSGEDDFDRIGGPDMLPVFGRAVVKTEKGVVVFDQFGHGLLAFHAISFNEEIRCASAPALVPACQMSCRWPLAFACTDLGIALSTLPLLCTQHPLIVVPPVSFEARDRGGRQAGRIRAQKRRQSLLKIAGGNALEAEPGQQLLDRLRPAQPGRQD